MSLSTQQQKFVTLCPLCMEINPFITTSLLITQLLHVLFSIIRIDSTGGIGLSFTNKQIQTKLCCLPTHVLLFEEQKKMRTFRKEEKQSDNVTFWD